MFHSLAFLNVFSATAALIIHTEHAKRSFGAYRPNAREYSFGIRFRNACSIAIPPRLLAEIRVVGKNGEYSGLPPIAKSFPAQLFPAGRLERPTRRARFLRIALECVKFERGEPPENPRHLLTAFWSGGMLDWSEFVYDFQSFPRLVA